MKPTFKNPNKVENSSGVDMYGHSSGYTSPFGFSHTEKTRVYEIWREGYSITGNSGTAEYLTSVEARSFKEACKIYSARKDDCVHFHDDSPPTIWGCRLFDNEKDARKSFG